MAEHPTPTTSDADGMPRVVTPRPEEAAPVWTGGTQPLALTVGQDVMDRLALEDLR